MASFTPNLIASLLRSPSSLSSTLRRGPVAAPRPTAASGRAWRTLPQSQRLPRAAGRPHTWNAGLAGPGDAPDRAGDRRFGVRALERSAKSGVDRGPGGGRWQLGRVPHSLRSVFVGSVDSGTGRGGRGPG